MANRRAGTQDKVSDKRNVDQIAELLDLPEWDEIDDLNMDFYLEMRHTEREEDESEEDHQERQYKAEQEAANETYAKWHDAVMHAADAAFDKCGLVLVPVKTRKSGSRPYEYRVTPAKSWSDAADKIVDVVNGVGYFYFNTTREFLDSGPYTAREAVLKHLNSVRDRPVGRLRGHLPEARVRESLEVGRWHHSR